MKHWIEAMRLRTLPLSLSGILVGSALAMKNGHFDWIIWSFAMLTTVLFQILSNFANDYGDGVKGTDNKDRIGPKRSIQTGSISPLSMRKAIIVLSVFSLISAGLLIYFSAKDMSSQVLLFYGILAILCVIAAITYTVGKSAYGYHGLGDLMVFMFFGLVSVLGVYSLYTKTFDAFNLLHASAIGLLSVGVLNLNNMRDRLSDEKSNKRTLAVLLGAKNATVYHQVLIFGAVALLFVYYFLFPSYAMLLTLIPTIFLAQHLRFVRSEPEPALLDTQLKVVALSTFAISALFFALQLIDFLIQHA